MATARAFYVTQGSLSVWTDGTTDPERAVVFADSDEGLARFDKYLAEHAEETSLLIVDVIEEEFAPDAIPILGMRDRAALIRRRLQRKFPRTHYRLAVYQGKQARDADEAVVIHSAISNHELLDPWLQIILRHQTPLTGVFSVPMMASKLLARFYKKHAPVMFLTQHQGQKLRQVFLHKGHVQSARLSQSPEVADPEYPAFIINEIQRSRRYLERTRLLGSMEQLEVFIVADDALARQVHAAAGSDSPMRLHFIDPDIAASRLGMTSTLSPSRMESLYIACAYKNRPKYSYGVSGESRFWHMRRMRHAIIGSAVAAAATCSILAGLYFSDAWYLGTQSVEIERQLLQLTETFRRENERFDPIKADSHEMKLAVDTGDYILANRLPVPWVMHQVGRVMGNYPDVQIQSLGWSAESLPTNEPPRRGNEQLPVPVPAIVAVSAEISGEIVPFDGNMRDAFARIDALVAELAARTAFEDVIAVEYPLDARPQASIAGEIVGQGTAEKATFRIRLRFPVVPDNGQTEGVSNEAV